MLCSFSPRMRSALPGGLSLVPGRRWKGAGERRRFDDRDATCSESLSELLEEAGWRRRLFAEVFHVTHQAFLAHTAPCPGRCASDPGHLAEAVEPARSCRRRSARREGAPFAKGARQSSLRHLEAELLGERAVIRRLSSSSAAFRAWEYSSAAPPWQEPWRLRCAVLVGRPPGRRPGVRSARWRNRRARPTIRTSRVPAATQTPGPERERSWRCARQRLLPKGSQVYRWRAA